LRDLNAFCLKYSTVNILDSFSLKSSFRTMFYLRASINVSSAFAFMK
jgi:hypothetical protein